VGGGSLCQQRLGRTSSPRNWGKRQYRELVRKSGQLEAGGHKKRGGEDLAHDVLREKGEKSVTLNMSIRATTILKCLFFRKKLVAERKKG